MQAGKESTIVKQWNTRSGNYPAMIVFAFQSHHCGYVGLPKSHPCYGKLYADIEGIRVHGGLTYSDAFHGILPDDQPKDLWWVGFDCAHYGDKVLMHDYFSSEGSVFRDADYVEEECEKLASQLFAKEE